MYVWYEALRSYTLEELNNVIQKAGQMLTSDFAVEDNLPREISIFQN